MNSVEWGEVRTTPVAAFAKYCIALRNVAIYFSEYPFSYDAGTWSAACHPDKPRCLQSGDVQRNLNGTTSAGGLGSTDSVGRSVAESLGPDPAGALRCR